MISFNRVPSRTFKLNTVRIQILFVVGPQFLSQKTQKSEAGSDELQVGASQRMLRVLFDVSEQDDDSGDVVVNQKPASRLPRLAEKN